MITKEDLDSIEIGDRFLMKREAGTLNGGSPIIGIVKGIPSKDTLYYFEVNMNYYFGGYPRTKLEELIRDGFLPEESKFALKGDSYYYFSEGQILEGSYVVSIIHQDPIKRVSNEIKREIGL